MTLKVSKGVALQRDCSSTILAIILKYGWRVAGARLGMQGGEEWAMSCPLPLSSHLVQMKGRVSWRRVTGLHDRRVWSGMLFKFYSNSMYLLPHQLWLEGSLEEPLRRELSGYIWYANWIWTQLLNLFHLSASAQLFTNFTVSMTIILVF